MITKIEESPGITWHTRAGVHFHSKSTLSETWHACKWTVQWPQPPTCCYFFRKNQSAFSILCLPCQLSSKIGEGLQGKVLVRQEAQPICGFLSWVWQAKFLSLESQKYCLSLDVFLHARMCSPILSLQGLWPANLTIAELNKLLDAKVPVYLGIDAQLSSFPVCGI